MTNTKHNPFAPQGRILSTPGSHPGNDRGMHTALTQDAPLTEAPQLITLRRSRRAANAVRRAANAARRAPVRNLRKAAKKKAPAKPKTPRPNSSELLPWLSYEKVIVMFSGGKDSIASVIALLEAGCPAHLIELWHQDVDGAERPHGFIMKPTAVIDLRDVCQNADRPRAEGLQLLDRLLQAIGASGADRDVTPLAGKGEGHLPAQAAAPARHQRHLACNS